jgi:hypothetical protein
MNNIAILTTIGRISVAGRVLAKEVSRKSMYNKVQGQEME